jgi:hypothetical protein
MRFGEGVVMDGLHLELDLCQGRPCLIGLDWIDGARPFAGIDDIKLSHRMRQAFGLNKPTQLLQ